MTFVTTRELDGVPDHLAPLFRAQGDELTGCPGYKKAAHAGRDKVLTQSAKAISIVFFTTRREGSHKSRDNTGKHHKGAFREIAGSYSLAFCMNIGCLVPGRKATCCHDNPGGTGWRGGCQSPENQRKRTRHAATAPEGDVKDDRVWRPLFQETLCRVTDRFRRGICSDFPEQGPSTAL